MCRHLHVYSVISLWIDWSHSWNHCCSFVFQQQHVSEGGAIKGSQQPPRVKSPNPYWLSAMKPLFPGRMKWADPATPWQRSSPPWGCCWRCCRLSSIPSARPFSGWPCWSWWSPQTLLLLVSEPFHPIHSLSDDVLHNQHLLRNVHQTFKELDDVFNSALATPGAEFCSKTCVNVVKSTARLSTMW